MISAPRYSEQELDVERRKAIENFRRERLDEPLEDYLDHVDAYSGIVEDLLETTVDLALLRENASVIAQDSALIDAFRYLAGPPISSDDLKTIADVPSIARNRLTTDPELLAKVVDVVRSALDRRRFPWVSEGREPTEAERQAAVLASAALMATRRAETIRRNTGKGEQEQHVEETFLAAGLEKVSTRNVKVLKDSPGPGQFCRESNLGSRKADFLVGLHDDRVLAIECKVSNSSTNSVKRLNNDAAAKAESWRRDFGLVQVVPAAVLTGVFKLHNLVDAQARGLTLFWAHDLRSLVDWIYATRK